MREEPHLLLVHEARVPAAIFDEFRDQVGADTLRLEIRPRPNSGPYAGLEWLLPTAVMLFVSQGYLNGFLNEAGKDHYQLLKKGVGALLARFRTVKVEVIGTPGKQSTGPVYSRLFSIWIPTGGGATLKLLLPDDIDPAHDGAALEAFARLLADYGDEGLPKRLSCAIGGEQRRGSVVPAAYNPERRTIDVLDPVSGRFLSEPSPADDVETGIALYAWTPLWRRQFDQAEALIRQVIGPDGRIEHVGSTAVDGLAAKPILDVLVGFDRPSDIEAAADRLERAGFRRGTPAEDAETAAFLTRSGSADPAPINLHLALIGQRPWTDLLRFRELLRGDAKLARRYEALKRRLAHSAGSDLSLYTAGKSRFIHNALETAE